MASILTISNGSTTIDLLASPYQLGDWTPKVAQWKDGGVFAESSFSVNKLPIFREYETVAETFKIHIIGSNQNSVISSLRSIISLLDSGYKALKDGVGSLVYFTAKSDSETNSRYALILSYKIEELPSQYSGSFYSGGRYDGAKYNVYPEIEITIERSHWLASIPGNGTQLTLTQNGITSSSLALPVMNYNLVASPLTHIYTNDVSVPSFSSNQIASTSFNLLPSSVASGDFLYIGSTNRPFDNVFFTIGTAFTGTGDWQIYTGSWTTLTPLSGGDFTSELTVSGHKQMVFSPPSTWTTVSINGVSAYWIRFQATSGGTTPTQTTRVVYTAQQGNINLSNISSEGNGDLSILTRLDLLGLDSATMAKDSKIHFGRRATSRGSNFSAFLNASSTFNPSGITISSGGSSTVNDPLAPSGVIRRLPVVNTGADFTLRTTFSTSGPNIFSEYTGKYRLFLRAKQNNGSIGDIRIRYTFGVSMDYESSDLKSFTLINTYEVIDFGVITIPEATSFSIFDIRFTNTGSTTPVNIDVIDIVLLPVDENAISISSGTSSIVSYLRISNLDKPGIEFFAKSYNSTFSTVVFDLFEVDGDLGILIENSTNSQIWMFREDKIDAGFLVSLYGNNRYLLPRGTV